MKILFLSQIIPYPPQGGVLQRGYYLLRELGRIHTVDMIAFKHPDILKNREDVKNAVASLLTFCRKVDVIDLSIKSSRHQLIKKMLKSMVGLRPFSFHAYSSKEFENSIKAFTRDCDYDIVHFDTLALSQYLPLIKGQKKTLTHHNVESELMLRRSFNEESFIKKTYFLIDAMKNRFWEKKIITAFDINITCSEEDARKLRSIAGPHLGKNIPNGVDTKFFIPKTNTQTDDTIIHVGALQSSNLDGIKFFLKNIWPRIVKKNDRLKLLLIGSSSPEKLSSYTKNDARVIFTGHIEDIRGYMAQAAVFIVPLRIGGGTKLKVLDALANGKAVVTTSVGAEGLELKDGKHVLIADEPGVFANAVLKLLENRELRIELGNAGRHLVESKYDWSIIGNELITTYNELIFKR